MDQLAVQVSDIATSAASHSMTILSNFLILLILTIVFILISYRSRAGIVSLLVSFYVAYALYMVFPYTKDIVGAGGSPIMKAVISIAIYAIACIVPYIFVERLVSGGIGILSVFPRFGLSFLAAAFLMALAYHVFPVSHIYTFPEPMNSLFAPDQYFFWWFVAPLIGLLLLVH
jgi:hypothetical protein